MTLPARPQGWVGQQEGRLWGLDERLQICVRLAPGVTAERVEDGEKGRRWGVRGKGSCTGRGNGDYCSGERGRSRCGAEASPRQGGGWGADGGRWVGGS